MGKRRRDKRVEAVGIAAADAADVAARTVAAAALTDKDLFFVARGKHHNLYTNELFVSCAQSNGELAE